MYRNLIKKIICSFLVISLVINYSNAVFAKNNVNDSMNIDGYSVKILEDNLDTITVETVDNGVEYVLTLNKNEDEYYLNTKKEESFIPHLSNEVDTQKVIIEEAGETSVEAKVLDGESNKGFGISQNDEKIKAQAPLVLGAGPAVAALIKALAATGAIVLAGVTWYQASKVISKLKRDQPNIHYYTARLGGGTVLLGKAIKSKSAAAARLRSGQSVFSTSSGYAYAACKSASPIGKVSNKQKHGSGRSHYSHYHPMKKIKEQMDAHCWFI